jgi:hypothetical protein
MHLLAAQTDITNIIWVVVLFAILVAALIFLAIFARYFRFWIQSVSTGATSASSTCSG